ncbi:TcdA/TcdB pore-forming domain-containing protein [Pseudomonas chlororaphis]|uniref:TcdA/TcdB pore-forming domain-containing protein n=1 Tax=Pseudomonas chlororaphis TaxID=587753 RepID=UPI0015DE35BE|nr:TcdA/TcdB pore-forming domain-containing protein [Pseudomonas chlororaphis]QLL16414.1 hypothetical protein H0I86_15550 [Pseudomonas chlororaphis subsp. aurantiaca]
MRQSWETLQQALQSLKTRDDYQAFIKANRQYFPPMGASDANNWLGMKGNAWADFTRDRFQEIDAARREISSRTNVADGLKKYEQSLDSLISYFNKEAFKVPPGDPRFKDTAAMAYQIDRFAGLNVLDYARAEVYSGAQQYYRDNKANGTSAPASSDEILDYWKSILGKDEPVSRIASILGKDKSWIENHSISDLQRLAVSMGDAGSFGLMTEILEERIEKAKKWMDVDYKDFREKLGTGGGQKTGRGEIKMSQMYYENRLGLYSGKCYAFSVLYAMAMVENGGKGVEALFSELEENADRYMGVTVRDNKMSDFRNRLDFIYYSPEVSNVLGKGHAGKGVDGEYSLKNIFNDLAKEGSHASYMIGTGSHAMVLATLVDANGTRKYMFFDPNYGSIPFTNLDVALSKVTQYLASKKDTYNVKMVNGEVRLDVTKLSKDRVEKLSALNMTGASTGKLGDIDGIGRMPPPYAGAMPGNDPEATVRQTLDAQRQGEELVKGLGEVMHQSNLDEHTWAPLLQSYDDTTHELTFTDTQSAAHEVKTVKVEDSRLREALHYVRDLPAKIKKGLTIEHGHFKPIEGVSHLDGMEALNAGMAMQTIIELMHAQHRNEETEEGKKAEGFSESLAKTLEAHVWVNVTGSAIATVKDFSKLGGLVGDLLKEGGEWTKLGEGLAKVGEAVGKVTEALGTTVDVVNVGFDIAELAQAETYEQKVSSGVQLGLDSLNLGVGAAGMIAAEVGAATAGAFLGALAVPLAGLGIGIGALVEDLVALYAEHYKISGAFDQLSANYQAKGYKLDDQGNMIPLDGVTISELDLVHNTVTFGKNTFKSDYDKLQWDLHEGFGVNGGKQNRHAWDTVQLEDKYKGRKVVVLPFAPNQTSSLNYDPMVGGTTGTALFNMNGKEVMKDDGTMGTIVFSPRQGKVMSYSEWRREFFNTRVDVQLGKDSVSLVMPAMKHLDPGGIAYKPPYAMNYSIHGDGGQYTLNVSNYGQAWLYEQDANAPSTWVLYDQKNGDIRFDGGYVHIGTATVWLEKPAATKLYVYRQNGEVIHIDMSDVNKPKTEVVDFIADNKYVQAHIYRNRYSSLIEDLDEKVRSLNLGSATVNWQLDGKAMTGHFVRGTKYVTVFWPDDGTASAGTIWHYRPNRIAAKRMEGEGLGGGFWDPEHSTALSDDAFAGFHADYFKQHPNTSLGDLVSEANRRGVKDFDVVGMPVQGQLMSGRYSAQSKSLVSVDKQGQIWDLMTGVTPAVAIIGFTEEWFKAHLGQSFQNLLNQMEQLAHSRSGFDVIGMPGMSAGDGPLNGHYDTKTKIFTATKPDGVIFGYNNSTHELELPGFDTTWFKNNGGTAENMFSSMLKYAQDHDMHKFFVRHMPCVTPKYQWLPTSNTLDGLYDDTTKTLSGIDKAGIAWTLSASNSLHLVGYTANYFAGFVGWVKNDPSMLIFHARDVGSTSFQVSGMPLKSGDVVSGNFDGKDWYLVGKSGEIKQYSRDSVDLLSGAFIGVSNDWVKQHQANLAAALAQTAEANGGKPFTVQWQSGETLLTGNYSPSSRTVTAQWPPHSPNAGEIWQFDDNLQKSPLLGVSNDWILGHQTSLAYDLAQLAKNNKVSSILIPLSGNADQGAMAWYDAEQQAIIVNKGPQGAATYLGYAAGVNWLFDAKTGQLFAASAEPVHDFPAGTLANSDALYQAAPAAAERMFTSLGKLSSAGIAGNTIVVETDEGLQLGMDLDHPGQARLLKVGPKWLAAHGLTNSEDPNNAKILEPLTKRFECGEVVPVSFKTGFTYFYRPQSGTFQSGGSEKEPGEYVGFNTTTGTLIVFYPTATTNNLFTAGDINSVKHAVRYGDVVGLDGLREEDIGKLPKIEGVNSYLVITDDELTFRVQGDKPQVLEVGPKWLAAHQSDANALPGLLQRYEHDQTILLHDDNGYASYDVASGKRTLLAQQPDTIPMLPTRPGPIRQELLAQAMSTFVQPGVAGSTSATPWTTPANVVVQALPSVHPMLRRV